MKKLFLAALLLTLPVAIAFAQPAAPGAPGSAAPKTYSLYGQGGAPAKVVVTEPKLNLLPTLEFMRQVINPHANAYWAQEGSLDNTDYSKVIGAPENDDQWNDQISRAATLMEAGNSLFTAGRPRNGACRDDGGTPLQAGATPAPARGGAAPARGGAAAAGGAAASARGGGAGRAPAPTCEAIWTFYAQQLIDGGSDGIVSSRAHNARASFEAGSKMYDACFNCHARFIPRPAVSRYTAPFPSDEEVLAKMKARAEAEAKAKADGTAPK